MCKFISIKDRKPGYGQRVIAIGRLYSRDDGYYPGKYMGIGVINHSDIAVIKEGNDNLEIRNITDWMPAPEWPGTYQP